MRVADLTPEELKHLIREAVLETISELVELGEEGDLSEDFLEKLRASLADTSRPVPAEEAARRLGLTW